METIEELADYIIKNGKKRIMLQFTNDQMQESFLMKTQLGSFCKDSEFFISADNTKNECCCDIKAATTVGADLIIKVGFSCLFDNDENWEIIYYFEKKKINFDIKKLIEK
jgi:diphthamide biosynthesis enzyme Dph1/Dph2-like protein